MATAKKKTGKKKVAKSSPKKTPKKAAPKKKALKKNAAPKKNAKKSAQKKGKSKKTAKTVKKAKPAPKIQKRVQKVSQKGAKKTVVAKPTPTHKPVVKMAGPAPSAKNFKPIRDQVLVKRDLEPEKTSGGLFIPTTALEKPLQGTVVAIGKGVFSKKGKFRATAIQTGDRVIFNKYSGQQIVLDGEELVVLKESDIIGYVEE